MRAIYYFSVVCLLSALVACGGTNKKEYPDITPVEQSLEIQTQWVSKVGDVAENQFQQLPTVVLDEKIYVASNDGHIAAINVKTGKRLWRYQLADKLVAGPAVVGDMLVYTNTHAEVIAVDSEKRQEIWRTKVSSIVLAKPLIVENKVLVQTVNGKVICLSKSTGKQLWLESREVPALTLRGTSAPIVVEDKVITGFANGKVAAMSLQSGKTVWETVIAVAKGRSDLERIVDVDGVFYLKDNVIYAAAYQGRIAAIELNSGQVLWMRDMSSYTGVISDGQQLFVTDSDGNLWGLETKTGETLWKQDALVGRDIGVPAVMQNYIIVGDGAGYIHWFAKEDGKLLAQQNLNTIYLDEIVLVDEDIFADRDAAVTASPLVYKNQLFVRDNAGGLSVFKVPG